MIGIIGAMEAEVKAIIELLENENTITFGSLEFHEGVINGKDVVVCQCGIGKVFAAMATEAMIIHYDLEYILNVGVAGALSDKLDVNSIAISSALVQHDMDTSPIGDPVGMISGINIINIPVDIDLVNKVEKVVKDAGFNYEVGIIASGDQFINDARKKDYIQKTFNAIACEMEGAAIAQVAYVNKVPFCVIRAMSDKADGSSHVDYTSFLKEAIKHTKTIINNLI